MPKVVFVNCKRCPFIDDIIALRKPFETRTRNTLGSMLGERILFAETGKGKPVVRCSAVINYYITVTDRESWEFYRQAACIPADSDYDWKPWTKKKVLYHLADVKACDPFIPPEGLRHGRVWMEFDGEIPT